MSLSSTTPFDQYSRQKLVLDATNALRKQSESFSILDVGGYKGKTAQFQSKDRVMVCDLFDVVEKDYVKTDGKTLPFKDQSFDFVVSFDALEHVESTKRIRFMEECLRVTRRGVIICAPYQNKKNEIAEKRLNELYKTLTKDEHRWLREHIENGLPDFNQLINLSQLIGYQTTSMFSNDIKVWALMQSALFTNEKYPDMASKLISLNEKQNKISGADIKKSGDHAYRQILFAMKSKNDISKIENLNLQKNNGSDNQEIEAVLAVVDYFVSIVKNNESKYKKEKKKLHDELLKVNQELEKIQTSKTWHYAQKISHVKNKLVN